MTADDTPCLHFSTAAADNDHNGIFNFVANCTIKETVDGVKPL